MIVAGVEEAGRGPVIGPMVMVLAMCEEKDEFKLKAMGVKDSKMLTPEQRERLYHAIQDLCTFEMVKILPEEIDAAVLSEDTNLNWLEADHSAILINKLRPEKVILDCPSTNIEAYKDYILKKLDYKPKLVVEHKADVKYTIVGAASILAKVSRDNEIKKLKAKYNVDFGSGYPSDPVTMEFTRENFGKYPFFRQSWDTWTKAKKHGPQRKLGEF
ncbi:MAG TPA: ribonuclease HII [Candidatus Nanoarchaeia archaeon]|nr:ribonuclease HII [Candidatus Nanoarchaeia archaeon]